MAASNGHMDTVKHLGEKRAQKRATGADGKAALDHATKVGQLSIADHLHKVRCVLPFKMSDDAFYG